MRETGLFQTGCKSSRSGWESAPRDSSSVCVLLCERDLSTSSPSRPVRDCRFLEERLDVELEARARVIELERLEDRRVQDPETPNLDVGGGGTRASERLGDRRQSSRQLVLDRVERALLLLLRSGRGRVRRQHGSRHRQLRRERRRRPGLRLCVLLVSRGGWGEGRMRIVSGRGRAEVDVGRSAREVGGVCVRAPLVSLCGYFKPL